MVLPTQNGTIFMRSKNVSVFSELNASDHTFCQILLISQGARNSILLFLAVLWQSMKNSIPVVFIWKTDIPKEYYMSASYITRLLLSKLQFDFARDIDKNLGIEAVGNYITRNFWSTVDDSNVWSTYKKVKVTMSALIFLDGPT
jgi:hypothetical protein